MPTPSDVIGRPSVKSRLAAIVIDLGLLFVLAPLAALVFGWALSWLVYLPVRRSCPGPCDGAGVVGFGLAVLLLYALWFLYWPLLVYWRRRTVGSRLASLRFEGRGLRRHFEWDARQRAGSN